MMTKRKAVGTTERTNTNTGLTALEEQVVRMRHGFTAPDSLALTTKAMGNAAILAELAAMEKRALEHVGPQASSAKSKIVDALRKKQR